MDRRCLRDRADENALCETAAKRDAAPVKANYQRTGFTERLNGKNRTRANTHGQYFLSKTFS